MLEGGLGVRGEVDAPLAVGVDREDVALVAEHEDAVETCLHRVDLRRSVRLTAVAGAGGDEGEREGERGEGSSHGPLR